MVIKSKKTVKELIWMFTETFKSIDEQTIHLKRKVFSNQILSLFLLMSTNHCGYQEALLDLNIKKLINNNVSHQAINKKSSAAGGSLWADNFHLFFLSEWSDHSKVFQWQNIQKNICGRWFPSQFQLFN